MNKKILILVFIVIASFLIFKSFSEKENISTQPEENTVKENNEEVKTISLCFYKEKPTQNGFFDRSMLRMDLTGSNVRGEFLNYPGETDSKVGEFSGTVTPVIPEMMARIADVWWEAKAEGMVVTEELRIIFGEGTASVGFGEMVDRGDGVYVYKYKENIGYWQDLTDVSCDFLDDRIIVEKYIRDNVKNLAPEKPVLGGSWYSYNIKIDPNTKTGEFTYEDGHILGVAKFEYTRTDESVEIKNIVKIK